MDNESVVRKFEGFKIQLSVVQSSFCCSTIQLDNKSFAATLLQSSPPHCYIMLYYCLEVFRCKKV